MTKIDKVIDLFNSNNPKKNIMDLLETNEEKIIYRTLSGIQKNINSKKVSDMPCDHNMEDICAYAEGNLDIKEKESIDQRLSSCDSCFDFYSDLKIGLAQLET